MAVPKTLRGGTFNILRDQPDKKARGNVKKLLNDHSLHFLALQEAVDYIDVLDSIAGYELFYERKGGRSAQQNVVLVRDDIPGKNPRLVNLGGDGWKTATGHTHVGCDATAVTVADWLRVVSLHLPPSIDWPHGHPEGPSERVDDYIANMRALRDYARGRKGSNGLCLTGDYNCKPGRDEGAYSIGWLAKAADLKIANVKGVKGHLAGIDNAVVDKDTSLTEAQQIGRYGSDHPAVIFKVRQIDRSGTATRKGLLPA